MRLIHPVPGGDAGLREPREPGLTELAELYAYPGDRWLRLNMVASADGGTWLDGLSGGLSGRGDRKVFGVLRGLADVVLAGAATVRAEGYGPAKPRRSWEALRAGRTAAPPIAVVTASLELDLSGPLFAETGPDARTIVVTCEAAPRDRREEAARHAEVIVAGRERVDLALAVGELGERGLGRVLCEGGARLNAQLAAAGLVDELCLTVSPLMIGGDAARILHGPASSTRLRLAHVLEDEGFLLTRYVREG